jgi:transposase
MVTHYNELTDSQWKVIKEFLPVQRKRKYCLRTIVNAIFWILRTGAQWRNLESRFPYWQIVYYYYWQWEQEGIWDRLNAGLNEWERQQQGRAVWPTLVCVDSQSVKTGPFIKQDKGWDGNKKVKGRKRHVLVDSLGLVRGVMVTAANEHDGIQGKMLLQKIGSYALKGVQKIVVDGSYNGTFFDYATQELGIAVEIGARPESQKGFVPIKWRWVVERTFGWFNYFRRLSKEVEKTAKSAQTMILLANCQIIINRI